MKATERGQSLVETALILPILVLFVFPALFAVFHLVYIQIAAKHLLYEYLICRETKFQESTCDWAIRRNFSQSLVGGKLLNFYHQKRKQESYVEVRFQTWYAQEMKVYEKIQLPLQ